MDEAKGEEATDRNLTLRILTVNFAAVHTSSRVSDFFSDFCIVKTFFVGFFARVLLPGYVPRVHATSSRGSRGGSQV